MLCAVCQATSHPLLWSALAEGRGSAAVAVQAQLGRPALSFLWDHSVQGRTILSGSAMCEMAVAAGKVGTWPTLQLPVEQFTWIFLLTSWSGSFSRNAGIGIGWHKSLRGKRMTAGAVRHGDSGMRGGADISGHTSPHGPQPGLQPSGNPAGQPPERLGTGNAPLKHKSLLTPTPISLSLYFGTYRALPGEKDSHIQVDEVAKGLP